MAPSSKSLWAAARLRRGRRRSGQALVESLVVLLAVFLLFFGLLDASRAFADREIMRHAAARAARARTVGFNRWMCEKVARASAIPASGKLLSPEEGVPSDKALADAVSRRRDGGLWDWALSADAATERAAFERARIPAYLSSVNADAARARLHYEGWDDISGHGLGGDSSGLEGNRIKVRLEKRHDFMTIGMAPEGLKRITLRGEFEIEPHYTLYIDDKGW